MKFGLIFLIGLLFISTWAFGALDTEDLEDIRGMFKESEDRMRAELVAMETRLRAELVAAETRLRAEIALVRAEIVAVEERLRSESTESEARTGKQLDRNFTLLVALIGFVAVVTGIPVTLVILQMRKERDRDAQLSAQQREISAQQREIDAQQQQLREQQQVIAALQQQLEGMHRDMEQLKQHSMFR